ncbi:hypothetical protein BJ166DRAFT_331403 [Pestalotiopsis sp. NC0098]|nr:hypothetical protein BJ166DRAFT_331403 [Pestalotiopsis sp. NC0098]
MELVLNAYRISLLLARCLLPSLIATDNERVPLCPRFPTPYPSTHTRRTNFPPRCHRGRGIFILFQLPKSK